MDFIFRSRYATTSFSNRSKKRVVNCGEAILELIAEDGPGAAKSDGRSTTDDTDGESRKLLEILGRFLDCLRVEFCFVATSDLRCPGMDFRCWPWECCQELVSN